MAPWLRIYIENTSKLVYQKSVSESLSLTEFGTLTDEILEITSILALMLRDGQSSSAVRKNSHKLENCLQAIGDIFAMQLIAFGLL